MTKDTNLYDEIFYCAHCGKPKHIALIYNGERCECGNVKFISNINYDIPTTLKKLEDDI